MRDVILGPVGNENGTFTLEAVLARIPSSPPSRGYSAPVNNLEGLFDGAVEIDASTGVNPIPST